MPCIKGSFPFWFSCNLLWFITRNQLIYTSVQTEENLESTKQQAKQYFFLKSMQTEIILCETGCLNKGALLVMKVTACTSRG